MQVAGSSVVILPLHASDIVAALSQGRRRYLRAICLTVVLSTDSTREMINDCIVYRAESRIVVIVAWWRRVRKRSTRHYEIADTLRGLYEVAPKLDENKLVLVVTTTDYFSIYQSLNLR